MTKKEWLILWLLYVAYLLMGALVFYTIERELEEERLSASSAKRADLKAFLEQHYAPIRAERSVDALAEHLLLYCDDEFSRILKESNWSAVANVSSTSTQLWTYYNAVFFTLTTLSTIGYGNLYPSSDEGRMILIVYSLIGIPLTGIILAQLGDFYGSRLMRAHQRYRNQVYESRITLILDVMIYLVAGIVIFVLAPTFIFMHFEDWTFYEAFYYAFVSLTTIGFGDLVAGQSVDYQTTSEVIYKIFVLVWIMFGLGYLVMLLGFITAGMRSKKVHRVEQKLAARIKQTQAKIWNEFVEDIAYIRRAFNMAYVNKVKPIYRPKKVIVDRELSQSCPDLSEWPVPMTPEESAARREQMEQSGAPKRRRRAFSENDEGLGEGRISRTASEGALRDIDVAATFRNRPRPSMAQTDLQTELFIANLVNSRKQSVVDREGGYNLFPDDEILSSEGSSPQRRNSGYHLPQRNRAQSVQFAPTVNHIPDTEQHTWAPGVGDSLRAQALSNAMRAHSEDIEQARGTAKPAKMNFRRLSAAAMSFFSSDKKKKNSMDKSKIKRTGTMRSSSSDHDSDLADDDSYFTAPSGRRASWIDALPTPNGIESTTPLSPVLEQTSLADFIRAMMTVRRLEQERELLSTHRRSSVGLSFPDVRPTQDRSDRVNRSQPSRQFRQRAASILPVFNVNGRSMTPPIPEHETPPAVVVTSPEGRHRFSVQRVASQRRRRRDSSYLP